MLNCLSGILSCNGLLDNDLYNSNFASAKLLDVNSNILCFIGAMKNDGQSEGVNCLDPLSGQLLWQKSNNTSIAYLSNPRWGLYRL